MTDATPAFFLSYARTPGPRQPDPDRPVFTFFEELRQRVARLIGVDAEQAGHVDLPDAPSDAWRSALAACRVFVPLYAPRYFTDPLCGRQWTAFKQRVGPDYGRAVVPVLWIPPTAGTTVPLAALDIPTHLPHGGGDEERHAPDPYAESGLYRLMVVEKDDPDTYHQVVGRLAERIARAWADSPARPVSAEQLTDRRGLEDAFAPQPSKPALRITVLAPSTSRLPPGREAASYGPDTESWRPYRTAPGSLTQQAFALARNLGFEPELVPFEKAYESIAHDGSSREPVRPFAPWVLVVDAWVLGDLRTAEQVQRINEANRPWLAVMAVLAEDDPQTRRDEERLLGLLEQHLSRHRPHTARGTAARGIAKADVFAWLFAELAKSCYLRYLDSIQDDFPRPSSGPARSHGVRRPTSD
ncbi:TIR-like protein FxsC [Streptomyces cyaneus]|uniref:TIR-like protein FxsC n=1 Tax=Streptomyces cyaneus TaxID=1904 RepID=UPI000FF899C3|nr:TIR-like protein FxsC [Streptomyces cyaneus]